MTASNRRVYFAHATNGGPIKMGATNDINTRIKSLGSCIPGGMEVITHIPGHFLRESYIKCALSPWRVQGEWFKSCAPVWRVIAEAIDTGTVSWSPSMRLYSKVEWAEIFKQNAATPGFRYIDNGIAGKSLFGRALFAADLFNRSLPAWLLEAHDCLAPSAASEQQVAA